MAEKTIGIKIADGSYYPVLKENDTHQKRLVLTTVNDQQENVQIDLYKGDGDTVQEAAYIGSLMIEEITPGAKGEAEIELRIGLDAEGNLNATAGDLATGDRQSLSLSMASIQGGGYDVPDFELDDELAQDIDTGLEESFLPEETEEDLGDELFPDKEFGDDSEPSMDDFGDETEDSDGEPDDGWGEEPDVNPYLAGAGEPEKRRNPLLVGGVIVLGLLLIGLVILLLARPWDSEPLPPLEAQETSEADEGLAMSEQDEGQPETSSEAASSAASEDAAAEEAASLGEEPEPASEPAVTEPERSATDSGGVPAAGRGGGVWYRIKWGDTLWDLSYSFYRTPWLYGFIADANEIGDPDKIYAGTDIFIPEK